jgi:NADH-quinone oxidoreductase subunit C
MKKEIETIVQELQEKFPIDTYRFRDEVSLIVKPEQLVEIFKMLKEKYNFESLTEETAVDYSPQESPRFHIVYRVRSISQKLILGVRLPLEGNSPSAPTIENVYKNANWFEREIWDMFGINFEGHSDLRRIIMPHDWVGHPLRKDYPLGYEEVEFSFNFNELNHRKPHAEN